MRPSQPGGGDESIGRFFGLERLRRLISANGQLGPKDLAEKIFKDVKQFRGDEPQADDLTAIVVEIEEGAF